MSNSEEPPFQPSNDFIKKLQKLTKSDGDLITNLMDKINNHKAPRVTECEDDEFIAYGEECKIFFDRKTWEFVNFQFKPK